MDHLFIIVVAIIWTTLPFLTWYADGNPVPNKPEHCSGYFIINLRQKAKQSWTCPGLLEWLFGIFRVVWGFGPYPRTRTYVRGFEIIVLRNPWTNQTCSNLFGLCRVVHVHFFWKTIIYKPHTFIQAFIQIILYTPDNIPYIIHRTTYGTVQNFPSFYDQKI